MNTYLKQFFLASKIYLSINIISAPIVAYLIVLYRENHTDVWTTTLVVLLFSTLFSFLVLFLQWMIFAIINSRISEPKNKLKSAVFSSLILSILILWGFFEFTQINNIHFEIPGTYLLIAVISSYYWVNKAVKLEDPKLADWDLETLDKFPN